MKEIEEALELMSRLEAYTGDIDDIDFDDIADFAHTHWKTIKKALQKTRAIAKDIDVELLRENVEKFPVYRAGHPECLTSCEHVVLRAATALLRMVEGRE